MKKNKFNHVGRPTIQEVNNYNKKKTLKIIGSGNMQSYTTNNQPWYAVREK